MASTYIDWARVTGTDTDHAEAGDIRRDDEAPTIARQQLETFIDERDYRSHADPNRTCRRAVAYWDRAEHRMRLEYGVEAWSQPPDCYARFQSGTKVAYGDSLPELRAIAERELPLLVAAIERRVKLAMGDA